MSLTRRALRQAIDQLSFARENHPDASTWCLVLVARLTARVIRQEARLP